MTELTLKKLQAAIDDLKASDLQEMQRRASTPWWQYEIVFNQLQIMEHAGHNIQPILQSYSADLPALYDQWKKRRTRQ